MKIKYWEKHKFTELVKVKTETELNRLTTVRLLAYYKAERQRRIKFNEFWYCGDHTYGYEWDRSLSYVVEILKEWDEYLNFVKSILNKREHIVKYKYRKNEKL